MRMIITKTQNAKYAEHSTQQNISDNFAFTSLIIYLNHLLWQGP